MGFEALITGFASTAADIIADRREKAEEYEDRMREMAERNKGRYDAMKQAAEANEMLVARARNLLASDEQISMALDSGPNALREMVQQLNAAKMDADIGPMYSKELVQQMFQVNEDYTSTNTDVRARFGLEGMAVGDTAAPDDDGFFARAFGRDSMGRARANLDQELVAGTDVSVFDLAGLSDTNLYQSLTPGSFINYTAPNVLTDDKFDEIQQAYLRAHNQAIQLASSNRERRMADLERQEGTGRAIGPDGTIIDYTTVDFVRDAALADQAFKDEIQNHMRGFFGFYGRDMLGFPDKFIPYLTAQGGLHAELGVPILQQGLNPAVDGQEVLDGTADTFNQGTEPQQQQQEPEGDPLVDVDLNTTYTVPVTLTMGEETDTGRLIPETGVIIDPVKGTMRSPVEVLDMLNSGITMAVDGQAYTGGPVQSSIETELAAKNAQLDMIEERIIETEDAPAYAIGRRARERTLAELEAQQMMLIERINELEQLKGNIEMGMVPEEDVAAIGGE